MPPCLQPSSARAVGGTTSTMWKSCNKARWHPGLLLLLSLLPGLLSAQQPELWFCSRSRCSHPHLTQGTLCTLTLTSFRARSFSCLLLEASLTTLLETVSSCQALTPPSLPFCFPLQHLSLLDSTYFTYLLICIFHDGKDFYMGYYILIFNTAFPPVPRTELGKRQIFSEQ